MQRYRYKSQITITSAEPQPEYFILPYPEFKITSEHTVCITVHLQ